jgi:glycosyltransferase involved in cell wall biosynthesis
MNESRNENCADDKEVDITFFVPCLNEEKNVIDSIETVISAVAEVKQITSYEILIFDDHSSDRTIAVVENYQKLHPDLPIRLIKNEQTRGLGYNYVEGAFIGRGKYYRLVCGDNQEAKDSMVKQFKKIGIADMILTYNSTDTRPKSRQFLSRIFVGIVNWLNGFSIKYYNSCVIHYRYNVMRWHPNSYGFAYQAELVTQLLYKNKTYLEVPIEGIDRPGGGSRAFTIQNLLSVSHSLLQILFRRVKIMIFGNP